MTAQCPFCDGEQLLTIERIAAEKELSYQEAVRYLFLLGIMEEGRLRELAKREKKE